MHIGVPKITIITINYNNASGLKVTVDSVLAQSCRDFEYIVIDGGSNDGSIDIISENADRINYWVSEKDKGIYNAMNKGISAARGEYLLFLNSGDRLMDSGAISAVVDAGLTADLVYGDLLFFDKEKEWTWLQPDILTFQIFFKSTIPHPSTFIKRALFESVGLYDEDLKIVADWKFFILALFKHNCSYKHIARVISAYAFDGISSNPENLETINAERLEVLTDNFPLFLSDYQDLEDLQQERKKIGYFLKARKLIKKISNQNR